MAYYIGVDLGATNVRAAVGDETGTLISSAQDTTPSGPTGKAVTDTVLGVVREACETAMVDPTSIAGAGIGAIGRLDSAAGVVTAPANLSDDIGPIPLVDPLSKLLHTENVYLTSDTLAGAIGERFHVHPRIDNMVYLTISSGIGAGIIADNDVFSGWNGNAGEVGHTTVDLDGFMTCGCGRDGHWEAYCSGNNIPHFARALHEKESMETALPLDALDFTAKHLFEYAGEDEFADHVIDRLAHVNTAGVANLAYSYAPKVISIGGAVALNNPEQIVEPIRARLDEAVLINTPEVSLSELGEQASLKGAVASAITEGTGDRSKV